MAETIPLNSYNSAPINDQDATPLRPLSTASSKTEPTSFEKLPRRSIWMDSWLFESILLAFSVGFFIGIAVVLYVYDGKLRPEIGHGISLNTIISVLATGCKSALLFVVGEAIGQLKWRWFQDPAESESQLVNIQRFDAASRGPLGSLMILFHHRACSIVSIGAAIIVLMLSFDPFVQLVLAYPVRQTDDFSAASGAFAPQLLEYITAGNDTGDIGVAYSQGFYSQNQDFRATPFCSSGNCTWDEFSSVGICSRCSNMTITAKLNCESASTKETHKTCNISIPGGFVYNFEFVQNKSDLFEFDMATFPSPIIWQPFSFNDSWISELLGGEFDRKLPEFPNATLVGVKNPQLAAVYIELGLNLSPISPNVSTIDRLFIRNATACSVSACLRDYEIAVENGSPSIKTKNIDFGTIYQDRLPGLCWTPGPPDAMGFQETRNFTFCELSMRNLVNILNYFPLTKTTRYDFDQNRGKYIPVYDLDEKDALQQVQLNRIGFEESMANMAASLTKYGLQRTNHSVNGTVQVTKVFVDVRWPWLILPGVLVVFGSIFLVVTIAVSKKDHAPLWKSSALASYYHGIEGLGDDEDDHNEYLAASVMEKRAETDDVRLERSTVNGRLLMLRWQDGSTSDTQGESSSVSNTGTLSGSQFMP